MPFCQLSRTILGTHMRLGNFYNQLLQTMASSERIFEILDTKPSVTDKPAPGSAFHYRSRRVSRRAFSYLPDRPLSEGSLDVRLPRPSLFVDPRVPGSRRSSICCAASTT